MTTPARKRGRPPVHGERLMLRVTADERRAWTALGRRAGLTLPQWIRHVCSELASRTG